MFRHIFHSGSSRYIALAAGAVHSFTARCGERIVCRGGCVLLSQFNVNEDFELFAGTDVIVHKHGLVVIEAIEASVIALLDAPTRFRFLQWHSRRSVDYLADDIRLRDKAPLAAVLAVVAIIAKHKIVSRRY